MAKDLKGEAPQNKMMEEEQGHDDVQPDTDRLQRRSRRIQKLPPQDEVGDEGGPGCSGSKRGRFEGSKGGAGISVEPPPTMMTRQRCANLTEEGDDAGLRSPVKFQTGTVELEAGEGSPSSSEVSCSGTGGGLSSAGPEGEEQEEEAHPCVFNEDALDHIFEFLITEPNSEEEAARDVKCLRLVCKTWRNSSTRLYRRSRAAARFDNCSRRLYARRNSLVEFVDTMRHSQMIPVGRFAFSGDVFFHSRNRKIFRDFLAICGPEMVALKFNQLGNFHFTELEIHNLENGVTPLEKFSLGAIPNLDLGKLKKLDILVFNAGRKTKACKQPHGMVRLLELLLPAAKELKKFEFFNLLFPPFLDRHATSIEPVMEVISKRIPGTVKTLRMHAHLNESNLDALAERGLKLKTFSLSHPSVLGIRSLRKFIEGQVRTLKDLHLCHHFDTQEALALELPRMEKLLNLELTNSFAAPFSFAKTLPQLERLKMWEMRPKTLEILLANSTRAAPALKELHLPQESQGLITPLVKKIGEHFPGIRNLHMSVERDESGTLQEVFTYLDGIETLEISLDGDMHNVDFLFTGMSQRDCERLRGRTFRNVNVGELRTRPSIVNLQRLQKLVLKEGEFWCDVVMTNVTAQFAFLEMDALRELSINGLESQISPRYMSRLREKMAVQWEEWNENQMMEDSDAE